MANRINVAITGVTGNMGEEVMNELVSSNVVEKFTVLIHKDKKWRHFLKKYSSLIKEGKVEVFYGSLKDKTLCEKLVKDVDYVINLASVIPPHSDKNPKNAVECNEIGVNTLVTSIENIEEEKQPKLIHISTVALYGNRNEKHPYAKVGDPLLLSPFDVYAVTKMRGEFKVLESKIKKWVVLRQSAMLHKNMLSDNMSDGLMFHTVFSAPLEWVTAKDSGVLIRHILEKDINSEVKDFWKRVFNIGGPKENQITGFDTLDNGFKIIGGSAKDFFSPKDNATRNFHGVWFSDGKELDKLFHYQEQTEKEYWNEILETHKIYSLGRFVPKKLIKLFTISILKRTKNAPYYWVKHKENAKVIAAYTSLDDYSVLPKKWEDFKEIKKENYAKDENIIEEKEIELKDLEEIAKKHSGTLLSKDFDKSDIYKKLKWKTQDGEEFEASAFTVLKAGHWYNKLYKKFIWDFDRLSKKDKVYASFWYDSHKNDENITYVMDENFKAYIKEF